MVSIIRPHGAITERLIWKVAKEREERFVLIDINGNRYGIEEETFNQLKARGILEYERNMKI